MSMQWRGVMPAITTPFDDQLQIDHGLLQRHVSWLVDQRCTAVVALGSLGEGATLSFEEKLQILHTCVRSVSDRVPVVAGISALSTSEAVNLAVAAVDTGCRGLMVLPPYVYSTDWREMCAHVEAIIQATELSCMLYNNPIAYRTDFLPEQIAELAAAHPNLTAVKESSADIRRITELRTLLGDSIEISVGLDDLIVEGIEAGAVGWIAGLVNALPRESVRLFELAVSGDRQRTLELYRWFLPLLRLDTVPKFVQWIKLVQEKVGMGNRRVRPPRLELVGEELEEGERIIERALRNRVPV